MCKNRLLSPLLLTVVLLWGCTSRTMFDGFKNYISKLLPSAAYLINRQKETPQTIKPFTSDEESKKAFRKLKAIEDWQPYMIDYDENYSISQALHDIEKSQHPIDVLAYLERLARSVVKHDIENKEPYTIALGLKLELDGTISMKRFPCSNPILQNILLFRLSINPKDAEARKQLKELYKKDTNPSGTMTELFPKIVVYSDDEMDRLSSAKTEAGYQKSSNTLYLRCNGLVNICKITRGALHELTHFRQWLQGEEGLGGVSSQPLTKKLKNSKFPLDLTCVIDEIDAEKQSVALYPEKALYTKYLEKKIKEGGAENKLWNALIFPYYTDGQIYLKMLKHLGQEGDSDIVRQAKRIARLTKHAKTLMLLSHGKSEFLNIEFPFYKDLVKGQCETELEKLLLYNELKHALFSLKWSNIPCILGRKTPISTGSQEIFDIKCKILNKLDEEEALQKGGPFPKKFSVNFSNKQFDNKE